MRTKKAKNIGWLFNISYIYILLNVPQVQKNESNTFIHFLEISLFDIKAPAIKVYPYQQCEKKLEKYIPLLPTCKFGSFLWLVVQAITIFFLLSPKPTPGFPFYTFSLFTQKAILVQKAFFLKDCSSLVYFATWVKMYILSILSCHMI